MRRLTKEILKEPTVKCSYCGREFSKPVAHKCKGNFRKRHLKWINFKKKDPTFDPEGLLNERVSHPYIIETKKHW